MNFSDYDSEDYSSDEDADYVPSEDNLSEDDMNECVNEDGVETDQNNEHGSKGVRKKKSGSKNIGVRKRKKGGLRLEEEESGEQTEEPGPENDEEDESPVTKVQEKEKKKADDLWASFLSDVRPACKPAVPVPTTCSKASQAVTDDPEKRNKDPSGSQRTEDKPKEPSKITITKVFDFAGEEVKVTKEVEADSKEAKEFLKTEERPKPSAKPAVSSLTPGPSVKRPAGVSSVLSKIGGKKLKMSTLEKSRLDWDAFKTEEGIGEDLAVHNRGKEGYVERKNFLERVDHRQFELEKNVRLSNMKR